MNTKEGLLKAENKRLMVANAKLLKDSEYWRLKYLEAMSNEK